MRVISGRAKGAKLFSPHGDKTRPTSDFVKENLFNIIGRDIVDVAFLDLFAGSGAIGIEALSRGASSATFIDISAKSIGLVRRNLEKTGLSSSASVIKSDAAAAVKAFAGQQFSIIFLDPPYEVGLGDKVLAQIAAADILAAGGYIVLEQSKTRQAPDIFGLFVADAREYSSTRLVFYEREVQQ